VVGGPVGTVVDDVSALPSPSAVVVEDESLSSGEF
jgi:hypothetical protein